MSFSRVHMNPPRDATEVECQVCKRFFSTNDILCIISTNLIAVSSGVKVGIFGTTYNVDACDNLKRYFFHKDCFETLTEEYS